MEDRYLLGSESFDFAQDYKMGSEKIQSIISLGLIIACAVLLRLAPHPANVAPIAAMALFGGAYLDKKYAIIVPLAALFISDLFLGFHASMLMVYTSFLLTGVLGLWLKNHRSVRNVFAASIVSSCIFYVLTNFNYWYATPLYPKTLEGLATSYINAIPFFRNTVIGDLLYTGLFFGTFELVQSLILRPKLAK